MSTLDQQNPPPAALSPGEQLADGLSDAADALHARVMRALRKLPADGAAPPITQTEAQALFDQEVALRQQANGLYTDAARAAIAGLAASQHSLLDLIDGAKKNIASIAKMQDLVGIGIDLLTLAGAIVEAKPERLLTAAKTMRERIQHLQAATPVA